VRSGSEDGTLRLWEIPSGACLAALEGHAGAIYDVAITPDARQFASVSQDGTVRLWDPESSAHRATLRPDRRYERMDITGLTGVTDVQKVVLKTLGAVERSL
jgi:WD40 repeat protein